MTTNFYNPVSEFYNSYIFDTSLPQILFNSHDELLKQAPTFKESCILINTNKATITKKININLSFPSNLQIVLILNIEFTEKGMLEVNGNNFTLSNISFVGGSKLYTFPTHIVYVDAQNFKLVNFEMKNVLCANADLDFFRVKNGVKNFHLYNSLLSGKYVNGVFLRLDFPYKFLLKNCVFKDFVIPNVTNGGEMIRMATGGFQNQDSFAVVDSCYFTNCKGDPEVLSIKCSSVTVKNTVFSDNGGKRLTLRSTHRDKIEHCYFGKDGIRVYGTNHSFDDIQLVDGANISLDNKSGTSYIVASNCKLNNIYHFNTPTPITNKGTNNTITNLVKDLKYKKESFFASTEGSTPLVIPTTPVGATGATGTTTTTSPSLPPISSSVSSPFKFIAQNRKIDSTVSPIILNTTDKINIQYISDKIQPYTFILSRGSVIVSTIVEKIEPYYLYGNPGDTINYRNLNTVGDYNLKIKETGEQVNFKVIKN
jgi:hypothetical protein